MVASTPRAAKLAIAFLLNDPPTPPVVAPDALFGASSPVSARPGSPPPPQPEKLALAPTQPLPAKTDETLPPRAPGPCSECGFRAPTQDALTAHARTAHPARPFACRVCGRCFGEKGNMNKHFRTVHLKQRRHSCGSCGRQFAFLDGLNRHISMVHLDRRPFECTHCQCPGGPHPASIPCTHVCGVRFKQKSHRRRHIRSVHYSPDTDATCRRCGVVASGAVHVCRALPVPPQWR